MLKEALEIVIICCSLKNKIAGLCNGSTHDSGSCCPGSSPGPAANKLNSKALSSRGSGHRPLTAATGVRIPLRLPKFEYNYFFKSLT